MTEINDGGAAFPRIVQKWQGEVSTETHGMSLRDWFAGQALVGLMGDPGLRPASISEFDHMARRLFQVADAMLKAREGGTP